MGKGSAAIDELVPTPPRVVWLIKPGFIIGELEIKGFEGIFIIEDILEVFTYFPFPPLD
jgi:hypothetical protein